MRTCWGSTEVTIRKVLWRNLSWQIEGERDNPKSSVSLLSEFRGPWLTRVNMWCTRSCSMFRQTGSTPNRCRCTCMMQSSKWLIDIVIYAPKPQIPSLTHVFLQSNPCYQARFTYLFNKVSAIENLCPISYKVSLSLLKVRRYTIAYIEVQNSRFLLPDNIRSNLNSMYWT